MYAGYQNEMRVRQQRRLEAGDRYDFELRVVITAVTNMDVERAIDAICEQLIWDDGTVTKTAFNAIYWVQASRARDSSVTFRRFELLEYSTPYLIVSVLVFSFLFAIFRLVFSRFSIYIVLVHYSAVFRSSHIELLIFSHCTADLTKN